MKPKKPAVKRQRQSAKSRHGSISDKVTMVKLSELRPSPENNDIYGRFNPDHEDDRALIEDIRKRGVVEPLVATLDGYVLSGHRRLAACTYLGLKEVPVRIANVRRGGPGYHELLTAYNRQRAKSVDEIVREQIASVDPEEAHRLLVEHRDKISEVSAETITIVGEKHRARISDAKLPFLDAIKAILEARREFWPLTDRQVHYGLLNDPPLVHALKADSRYQNTLRHYKALCELITRARLTGQIPFNAIHDPTRPSIVWEVHRETTSFVRKALDGWLKGYYRDLMQSQPNQIEIVGEKSTIENIIKPVAEEYCIPLTIGRGYCSLPPRHKMAERFKRSGKKNLILLVLSDFDPEGEDIPHSFARSMRDDFGIDAVKAIKVALTAAQVEEMNLPPQMKAKAKSSRHDKFVDRHGDDVFELEAVDPEVLQELLYDAIDSVIDTDAFNKEVDLEKADAAKLLGIRRSFMTNMGSYLPDLED